MDGARRLIARPLLLAVSAALSGVPHLEQLPRAVCEDRGPAAHGCGPSSSGLEDQEPAPSGATRLPLGWSWGPLASPVGAVLPWALAASSGPAASARGGSPAGPPGPLKDESSSASLQPQGAAASNQHTARWRVFTDQGREMFSQGRMKEAERYFTRALEEARLGFGEEDAHVASACNNLAELYRILGRFGEAEPLYLQASQLLRQAAARAAAAASSEAQGASGGQGAGGSVPLDSSIPLEDPAAAAAAAAAGAGAPGLAAGAAFALHNLGGLYLRQGHLGKAEASYKEALEIKASTLGVRHPEYANTLFHLAEVFRAKGMRDEAAALLQRSIRILEESEGGDVHRISRRTMRLAHLLMRSGAWEEAEALQRRGLHLVESSAQLGPDSQAAAAFAEGVAQCLLHRAQKEDKSPRGGGQGGDFRPLAQGHTSLEEAQGLLQRSFEVKQAALGKGHVAVAMTLLRLAETLIARLELDAQGTTAGVVEAHGQHQQQQQQQPRHGDWQTQLSQDAQIALSKAHSIAEAEWDRVLRRRPPVASPLGPRPGGPLVQTGDRGAPEAAEAGGGALSRSQSRRASLEVLPLVCLVRCMELHARLLLAAPGDTEEAIQSSGEAAMKLLERALHTSQEEAALVSSSVELQSAVASCQDMLDSLRAR